jgi:hypothetical protein
MGRISQTGSVVAALVVAGLALASCTILSRRAGEPIPVAQVPLHEGDTTAGQLVAALGPPSRMSALPGGFAILYEYIHAEERQLGINLDFIGIDWFKMATGRGVAERQALLLVFDDGGTLRGRDFRAWTEPVGKGRALQFLFVAMPTVDTRHLWETSEQHLWGRSALEPLPVTLNAGQSVVTGSHGLEMRGTPRSAGQRTLEGEDGSRRRQR